MQIVVADAIPLTTWYFEVIQSLSTVVTQAYSKQIPLSTVSITCLHALKILVLSLDQSPIIPLIQNQLYISQQFSTLDAKPIIGFL